MAMAMLEAGGLEIVTDGVRVADEHNPRATTNTSGSRRSSADADESWLESARGKAIKVISFLLPQLPARNNYRVIFMHRDMGEVLTSQRKMLDALGECQSRRRPRIAKAYAAPERRSGSARRRRVSTCSISIRRSHRPPVDQAERLNRFLGGGPDVPGWQRPSLAACIATDDDASPRGARARGKPRMPVGRREVAREPLDRCGPWRARVAAHAVLRIRTVVRPDDSRFRRGAHVAQRAELRPQLGVDARVAWPWRRVLGPAGQARRHRLRPRSSIVVDVSLLDRIVLEVVELGRGASISLNRPLRSACSGLLPSRSG